MTDPFDTVRGVLDAWLAHTKTLNDGNYVNGAMEALAALASIEERLEASERNLRNCRELLKQSLDSERANADKRLRGRDEGGGTVTILSSFYENLIRDAKRAEAAERERDEALHAEEIAEQYREKAEARVVELEAALRETASDAA